MTKIDKYKRNNKKKYSGNDIERITYSYAINFTRVIIFG